jgi:hypothetical protein
MFSDRHLSRRHALRLAGGLLAAPLGLRLAGSVSAGRGWCRADPTVQVNGQIVHLYVSGQLDQTYDVAGPTQVVVHVPDGVETAVLDQDDGFGQGYNIWFVTDPRLKATNAGIGLSADVYVPATAKGKGQPILLEWVPDGVVKASGSKQGTTNQVISLPTQIKFAPPPPPAPKPKP